MNFPFLRMRGHTTHLTLGGRVKQASSTVYYLCDVMGAHAALESAAAPAAAAVSWPVSSSKTHIIRHEYPLTHMWQFS